MVPTLLVGDYLFVSKFSYGYSRYSLPFGLPLFSGRIFFHPPERGDVAVFKLPTDNSTDYIKRVIGLPGDHIQMRNGILYINDQPCPRKRIEDYLYQEGNGAIIPLAQYIETLPNGRQHPIIKMGDNGPLDNTQVYKVPAGRILHDGRQSRQLAGQPGIVGGRLRSGGKPGRARRSSSFSRPTDRPGCGRSGNGRSRSATAGCSTASIEARRQSSRNRLPAEELARRSSAIRFARPELARRGSDPSERAAAGAARPARESPQARLRAPRIPRRPGVWAWSSPISCGGASRASRRVT